MTFYTLFWRDGSSNFIEGETVEKAFTQAGYGAGAINAIDWYENCIDQSKVYDYKLKKWIVSKTPDYVDFDEICRVIIGKQTQYGARSLNKEMAKHCNTPYLAEGIRMMGDFSNFYSYKIHKDDIIELINRFRNA